MCGITGYINFRQNFTKDPEGNRRLVHTMAQTIRHRGPDEWDEWVSEHAVFANNRLAVIDIKGGKQPTKRTVAGYDFTITYSGELYNAAELRKELQNYGYDFSTKSDTEVLLYAYVHYGPACAAKLNGMFAFCIWDTMRQQAFLCRDRFGMKPLFYCQTEDTFIFGSELKALLSHPDVHAEIGKEGLCELFAMAPARTPGTGVFKNIRELRPAKYMILRRDSTRIQTYWSLKNAEHTDSYDETVLTVRALMCDSIQRQLVSDIPVAALLSGGMGCNIVTAAAARTMHSQEQQLSTYSFRYTDCGACPLPEDNTSLIQQMSEHFKTRHTALECGSHALTELLKTALLHRDFPGIADLDAALLYFSHEIKKHHTVLLSGEGVDAFLGIPAPEAANALESIGFPNRQDLLLRSSMLKEEVAKTLDLNAYTKMRYDQSVAEAPAFDKDTPEDARQREFSYLRMNWLLSGILERNDRMSMAAGLEIRFPFCDHRLVEYAWNIPAKMKTTLLHDAAGPLLPGCIPCRQKSPSRKIHCPQYDSAVKALFLDTISDPNQPLLAFADQKKLIDLCNAPFDDGLTLSCSQFIGYLLQLNDWFNQYHVRIV